MKGTINIEKGVITELPTMTKELCLRGIYPCTVAGNKRCECKEYNDHIASLKSYDISGEWKAKTGDVVQFETGYQYLSGIKNGIDIWTDCDEDEYNEVYEIATRRIVAVPVPDKQPDEAPFKTPQEEHELLMTFNRETDRQPEPKEDKQQSEEAEMPFRYFVSYFFKNGKGTGFGSIHILRNKPIETYDDINALTEFLAKKNGGNPVVLNYILLPGESKSAAQPPHTGEREAIDNLNERLGWLIQDIDITLDYAISDKEKLRIIQKRIKTECSKEPQPPHTGEREAIAFAEWINGCMYSRVPYEDNYGEWTDGNEIIANTTPELYQQFLKTKFGIAGDK